MIAFINKCQCVKSKPRNYMRFKKLELTSEKKGIKRLLASRHLIKTLLSVLIGFAGGMLFFYLTEGRYMESLAFSDFYQSMLLGGLIGLFITNSPCARNKC